MREFRTTRILLSVLLTLGMSLKGYATDSKIFTELGFSRDLTEFAGKSLAITFKFHASEYTREDCENLLAEIDRLIEKDPQIAFLHLVRGNLLSELAALKTSALQRDKVARKAILENPQRVELIAAFNSAYERAINLSRAQNHAGLSIDQLQVIVIDVLGTADVKVMALREQLTLWNKGHRFELAAGQDGLTESQFRYSIYSNMTTFYVDENRFPEALAILDEMQGAMPHLADEIERAKADIQQRQEKFESAPASQVQ